MGIHESILYLAKTTSKINHYLISYLTDYEALETEERYPEKVTIKGPDYLREFDAEPLLEKLQQVGSTDEVIEILGMIPLSKDIEYWKSRIGNEICSYYDGAIGKLEDVKLEQNQVMIKVNGSWHWSVWCSFDTDSERFLHPDKRQ